MRLAELFNSNNIVIDLPCSNKTSLLETIVDDLNGKGRINDRAIVFEDLVKREAVISTGIGNAVAIPHAYTDGVKELVAGFYRTAEPVDFEAIDHKPVDLFFVMFGPKDKESRRSHIRVLAKISRLLNHEDFREDLRGAADVQSVIDVFRRFGDR